MTSLPIRGVGELERRGLRDRVYDRILEMLLEGEVEPGARLSIDTLARQLDVSPTPVREAMVQLERTGLVTREALRGYRVAPPLQGEQLAELFDARQMLEVEAARLAAEHADELLPPLRKALEHHARESERIVARLDQGSVPLSLTRAYFDSDLEFHRTIFAASGNRYIQEMYDALGALTHRMRQAIIRGPRDVHEAAVEHRALVDAFASGDSDAAVQAMRRHIENVRARSVGDTDS
ncbi:GntR family transcriptional regulator [Agromyces sp. NPDC056523]|uniref:GntR family transcriptional regulator n=1 Tax=Agromyces sp. NPDC056523 TaxID=3345850 RepID=UPI0036733BF0